MTIIDKNMKSHCYKINGFCPICSRQDLCCEFYGYIILIYKTEDELERIRQRRWKHYDETNSNYRF